MRTKVPVLLLAAHASLAHAQADCSEPTLLKTFLESRCASSSDALQQVRRPALVLTIRHVDAVWSVYEAAWGGKGECHVTLEAAPDRLEEDIDNTATIEREREERLLVVVSQTNPMLYDVAVTDSSEASIPELVDLQKFSVLFAGSIGSGMAALRQVVPLPPDSDSTRYGHVDGPRTDPLAARPARRTPLPTDALNAMRSFICARIEAIEPPATDLGAAARVVGKRLQMLSGAGGELGSYLQRLEVGDTLAEEDWLVSKPWVGLVTTTQKDFDNLAITVTKLPAAGCAQRYADLRRAGDIVTDPHPPSQTVALRAEFDDLTQHLVDASPNKDQCDTVSAGAGACQDGDPTPALGETEAIVGIARWMRGRWATDGDPQLEPRDQHFLRQLAVPLFTYGGAANARAELVGQATKLLGGRSDATSSAARLQMMAGRERERAVKLVAASCPGAGFVALAPPPDPHAWDKVYTHKFKVSGTLPAGLQPAHPASLDRAYALKPRHRIGFAVGFGTTWTDVRDQEFGAVTTVSAPGKKYVGMIGDAARAGGLAALLSIMPGRQRRLAVDIGTGVEPSKPRFFVGGSLKLGFVRLGGGLTWQEVGRLAVGQTELKVVGGQVDPASTLVTDGSEVRTRSIFQRGPYVSLVFALESLPFFKPKD